MPRFRAIDPFTVGSAFYEKEGSEAGRVNIGSFGALFTQFSFCKNNIRRYDK
jgi:hypothetical protein